MNMLIFKCPNSDAELVSGIRLDDRTCEVVENLRVLLPCTVCRTTHQLRVRDGHYKIPTAPPDSPPLQPLGREPAMAWLRKVPGIA